MATEGILSWSGECPLFTIADLEAWMGVGAAVTSKRTFLCRQIELIMGPQPLKDVPIHKNTINHVFNVDIKVGTISK
jgi:hypothetical protein